MIMNADCKVFMKAATTFQVSISTPALTGDKHAQLQGSYAASIRGDGTVPQCDRTLEPQGASVGLRGLPTG